jgi:hypothetical protein
VAPQARASHYHVWCRCEGRHTKGLVGEIVSPEGHFVL